MAGSADVGNSLTLPIDISKLLIYTGCIGRNNGSNQMKAEDVRQKPKPTEPAADGMHWRKCSKCRGTGVWAKGVLNGHLHSNTGFVCWTCNGTGWQQAYRPIRQAKATISNDFEIPF